MYVYIVTNHAWSGIIEGRKAYEFELRCLLNVKAEHQHCIRTAGINICVYSALFVN